MNAPVILGPDGSPLRRSSGGGGGKISRDAFGRMLAAGFNGASYTDPDLAGWTPPQYSANTAYAPDRVSLTSRIHDLARNDGWASGAVTRQVDSIIGANWRLTSKPNYRSLGMTPDAADELADQIEAAWTDWATDPDNWIDAGRRLTFGGLLSLAFRHRLMDGEALAAIMWLPRPGSKFSTAVQVIDPDRLSNPYNGIDLWNRRQGVELGLNGEPLGYHVRMAHPGDTNIFNPLLWNWQFIPRETNWGRRMMVHAFEADRAGQVRGIPILAPVVKRLRMLGRYDEAELQAAVLNAVMAAVITTPYDHDQFATAIGGGEELSNYQQSRLDYYDAAPINLGGAKMVFAFPGEEVKLTAPNHPNSVFEAFTRASLRNIAAAMGMTYEQLSMDWSQVNYSSARAALLEVWKGYTARKDHFAAQFVAPIYAAWLEEAVDNGTIKLPAGAPDFLDAKSAYCAARWIGPGRGWVDPLKEATAAQVRIDTGISTLERETAESQGEDYIDNLRQQAREMKQRADLKLPPTPAVAAMNAANADDPEDDSKPEKPKGGT